MPPKSEWLNWAMLPPPERSARRIVRTASAETEWRIETREMNPSSFGGMVAVLGYPQLFVNLDVCSHQKRHARYRIYRTSIPLAPRLDIHFRFARPHRLASGAVIIVAGTVPPYSGGVLGDGRAPRRPRYRER